MPPRKLNPVLDDIIDAIDGIEAAVQGKTFEEFQSDWLLRHGVQRGLEIISEASRHIPEAMLARAPASPGGKFAASAISCGTSTIVSPMP